jgi:LCP family protein required for cell wall assembly
VGNHAIRRKTLQVKGYSSAKSNAKSGRNGNGAKKGRNANSKKLKILLGVLGTLVAGFVVVAILLGLKLTNDDYSSLFVSTKPVANISNDNNNIIDNREPAETQLNEVITYNGKTYKKNEAIVNLLFLGIDSDNVREQLQLGYRSDMMMVCAVDTASKTATLLSIPRDTYTDVFKIDYDDGSIQKTVREKLNAAYSYGGGPKRYGASNAKACIQNFLERKCELESPLDFTLDIPVSFYASIDMDGITKIAQAVDGVEVTLDQYIPNVGREGETVTLKYDNAQEYLRNRHDSAGSDFGRTSHQRTFMIALAKKIKDMGPVDAVTKLWDEFSEFGKTDLSIDQALDFAKILNGVNIDTIQQLTIPGESKTVDGSSVVLHDEAATLEILLSIYYTEV